MIGVDLLLPATHPFADCRDGGCTPAPWLAVLTGFLRDCCTLCVGIRMGLTPIACGGRNPQAQTRRRKPHISEDRRANAR